jgi:hypothetical protein
VKEVEVTLKYVEAVAKLAAALYLEVVTRVVFYITS